MSMSIRLNMHKLHCQTILIRVMNIIEECEQEEIIVRMSLARPKTESKKKLFFCAIHTLYNHPRIANPNVGSTT